MAKEINIEANEEAVVNRVDDMPPVSFKPAPSLKAQAEKIIAEAVEKQRDSVKEVSVPLASLNVKAPARLDFSKMTEDDVYNLDVPIEARPFATEDSLKVTLKDSNYIARWVNKNPIRLGGMIAKGFTYVTSADLAQKLEVEVSSDAADHYIINDVVLMMIPKDRYYSALRAAHLRAVASVGAKGAHRAALTQATEYLNKETGGAYTEEAEAKKIEFYTPGVTI